MAVYVDLECDKCGERLDDQWSTMIGEFHGVGINGCTGKWERVYTLTPAPAPGAHPSERVVVYQSHKEGGAIQYPGRNDVPVPQRLIRRGYERVEIHPAQLGAFERKHGVKNERRHFDRNGRGFED